MKFTCTQQNFNRGLSITEKIIGRNFSLPILQNILIACEKSKGTVELSSTDLEMGIEVVVPAKVDEEGSITIPARLINSFVQNLPDEKIEFSEKNKKISVQCKNYRSNIKGQDAKEFPLIPQSKEDTNTFLIKSEDFISGMAPVITSASLLDIKPEISGVYVQIREDDVCFAATDSFRLAEKIVKTSKNDYLKKVIVPRRTADMIIRIFQAIKDPLDIQVDANQIIIKNSTDDPLSSKVRFVSKLIDGEYPNYEQIIPKNFTTSVKVSRDELIRHIKTASLFSSKIHEVVLKTNLQKQCLEVTAEDPEHGDHHSTLPCAVEGKDEKVVLNFDYLLDGIQNSSSENVILKVNQATTPILITAFQNEGFRYVLMPIKS